MIRILNMNTVSPEEIFARPEDTRDVTGIVTSIIDKVKSEGDQALFYYAKEFDKADLQAIEVPQEQLIAAVNALDDEFRAVLEEAAENIRSFHRHQVRNSFIVSEKDGVILGQKVTPIEKVGLYIPGGTAAYPSSVLMNCIPAKIAGCREIVMVSPPHLQRRHQPHHSGRRQNRRRGPRVPLRRRSGRGCSGLRHRNGAQGG